MKRFVFTTLFTCYAFAAVSLVASERPPNVILILTDDQGYGDFGCHGHPALETPEMDRLYSDSVRMTDFHVDPTCSPTRAALMTGKYASRVGVWHTLQGRSILRHNETTLADRFRDAGYRTGIFGKWHLGDAYPYRPQDRGFDETLIHGGGGIGQNPDYWGNTYFDDHYCRDGRWEKFNGYCTDVWFREATQFIERNQSEPFFCYLPLNAPHFWYRVPDRYAEPYLELGMEELRARFFGMIACIDANLGQLRDRLGELGIADNTILIFMNDNGHGGPTPGKPSPYAYHAGLRKWKGSPYDGGHRAACFVHWPNGGLTGGRDIPELTAHFDLTPTLIDLCGLQPAAPNDIDGCSFAGLLHGEQVTWPDRTLCVHNPRVERPEKWLKSAVMTERWRLVEGKQLFDIQTDPGQENDIASKHPKVVEELRSKYLDWWSTLQPRFDEFCRVYIGAAQENPVKLTCHDWHSRSSLLTWNPDVIANRQQTNGWWTVQVERPGTYTFRLQELPDEAESTEPIRAERARLRIGAIDQELTIPANATSVEFNIDLPAGPFTMKTWLIEDSGDSRGAPFVHVNRHDKSGQ
ncbi:arylsulfatase [Crateriforma spongiae]|uniref:arylsulfatase n=1 Tax=Crateriforma spongiae TaxID=2724528 RepID=UPI0014451E0F|nr:arylsulfatase [Crateriforma spongiae]